MRPLPALGVLVALAVPAGGHAAGPYDGTWVVETPAVGGGGNVGGTACAPVRFQFKVTDNQISGSLRLNPSSPYGATVQQGSGRGATPIQGTVNPDGSVTARWQSFQATGTLAGGKAELRWKGKCGPRIATGGRMG